MTDRIDRTLWLLRDGGAAHGRPVLTARAVLRLQRTLGNREVVRLLVRTAPPRAPAVPVAVAAPRAPLAARLALAWARVARRTPTKETR